MNRPGVVIPTYNEERKLGATLEDILPHIADVVVVNDGSIDNTAAVARQYPVTLIDRKENKGLAATVAEGFSFLLANGFDYGIKLDGDGQMQAATIPLLIETAARNPDADIVCATYDSDTPWMIRKDMAIYSAIYRIATGIWTIDVLSEFRLYSRKGMQYLVEHTGDEGYGSPLILFDMHRAGMRSVEVKGGVSYSQRDFRPLPVDAQYALRKAFVTKSYQHPGIRSKAVAIGSVPFWAALLVFNCTVQPKYHSFLPKRWVR